MEMRKKEISPRKPTPQVGEQPIPHAAGPHLVTECQTSEGLEAVLLCKIVLDPEKNLAKARR